VNSNLKKKFLSSFTKFFIQDQDKTQNLLRNLFAIVGDRTNKALENFDFHAKLENEELLKESMNSLMNILFSPFGDFEIEALALLIGPFFVVKIIFICEF